MSSVTRFIRQIPVEAQRYSAATVAASPASMAYELVPSASNVVGNYPNGGYVQLASAALILAIQQAVNAAAQMTGAGGPLAFPKGLFGNPPQEPAGNPAATGPSIFPQITQQQREQ